MTRWRWIALAAVTLVCLLVAWSGRPSRQALVPGTGLSPGLRFAAVVQDPPRLWARLDGSALIDGLFTYDPAAATNELSAAAKALELPPLEPPAQLDAAQRRQVAEALYWLRPTQAAVVQFDRGGQTETWLGVQGSRVRLAGRLASWFSSRLVCGDAIWVRLEARMPTRVLPPGAGGWDWPRETGADLQAVLPRGLPAPTPAATAEEQVRRERQAARLAAVCAALGLPVDCRRLDLALTADGSRLAWQVRCLGSAAGREPGAAAGRVDSAPRVPLQLPAVAEPGVFLTVSADVDWVPLYRNLVAGLEPAQRADFERSMRWYRMIEKGYEDPERDFLAPLGRGLAIVGRRGARYNGVEWMPAVQAELPLRPPPESILSLVRDTPNEKFRKLMPDFAQARFDKIRLVGESGYNVHPSYVAVTLGPEHDRYVLMRPTIAGSALMPAWQVDERRIKFGTRPDVLDGADLFLLPPAAGPAAPAKPAVGGAAPVLQLYLDPAAITDQLDNFRILVKVEAGSDRPTPDDGLTLERIAAENERMQAVTRKNMRLAAQVGWVLQRIGPLELTVLAEPEGEGCVAEIRGSVALKAR